MYNVIKNLYKVKGLFICKHPVHERFDFQVSPYHILKHKRCFNKGCIEFLWRCSISNKGKKCPRGYKHVGRNCFSCKYYYEEKICRMPEALISDKALKQFFCDLDDFEYWLSTVENKRINFTGKICSVLPCFHRTITNGRINTRFNGFLIKFERGHIGYDLFDDPLYLRVGNKFLEQHKPAPDDELEFEAKLVNNRGRMVLLKPSRLEINRGDNRPLIDYSRALVARSTGAIVRDDIRLCRNCPHGALIDIEETESREIHYRRFYCLQGCENSYSCPVRLDRILAKLNETASA